MSVMPSQTTANSTIHLKNQWHCGLQAHCDEKPHRNDGFPSHTIRNVEAVHIMMSKCRKLKWADNALIYKKVSDWCADQYIPMRKMYMEVVYCIFFQWENKIWSSIIFIQWKRNYGSCLFYDLTCMILSLHPGGIYSCFHCIVCRW